MPPKNLSPLAEDRGAGALERQPSAAGSHGPGWRPASVFGFGGSKPNGRAAKFKQRGASRGLGNSMFPLSDRATHVGIPVF